MDAAGTESTLKDLFSKYISSKRRFDRKFYENLSSHTTKLLFRSDHAREIAMQLAPVLNGIFLAPVFVFGPEGSGKSRVLFEVYVNFRQIVKEKDLDIRVLFIDCADERFSTPYKFFSSLATLLGVPTPHTGLSLSLAISNFREALSSYSAVVLFLDNFASVAKKLKPPAMEALKHPRVFILAASRNPADFGENWPLLKRLFHPKEVYLPSYTAEEVFTILKEKLNGYADLVTEPALRMIAAYAKRKEGGVKLAIELLKHASILAERLLSPVTPEIVKKAFDELYTEKLHELIETLSSHHRVILKALVNLSAFKAEVSSTELYQRYLDLCKEEGIKAVSYRRFFDIISELDSLGIVSAIVVSKGRYGRKTIVTPRGEVLSALEKDLSILEV